jgi:hypothetical protein
MNELLERLYPQDGSEGLSGIEFDRTRERYYQTVAEYADRLPRVPMSVCPYCGEVLSRSIDPFGFDGPWWHTITVAVPEEPRACEHFRVLLGAVKLSRPAPREARDVVKPGPDVPFVVPALFEHPGMIAVIATLELRTGDLAYPIAYFSAEEVPPPGLHQPWCRDELWFTDEEGKDLWIVANDTWDFDLGAYVADGRVRWADLASTPPRVLSSSDGASFPYGNLAGERLPQIFTDGERETLALPDGETLVPFGEPDDPPPVADLAAKIAEARKIFAKLDPKDYGITPEDLAEFE